MNEIIKHNLSVSLRLFSDILLHICCGRVLPAAAEFCVELQLIQTKHDNQWNVISDTLENYLSPAHATV